ncbi:periphilin-1-like isoform X2 [Solea solea]|nr:periphilin-1-like isoform X2 [Solea solea]
MMQNPGQDMDSKEVRLSLRCKDYTIEVSLLKEPTHLLIMAYRHGRSIRDAYEKRFSGIDAREVTVHRLVSIVDERNQMPRQEADYDRRFQDNQWSSGTRNYRDSREFCEEGYYQFNETYCDENPNYLSFLGNPPPPENEGHHSHQFHSRESRKPGRHGPNFRNRGRGLGPRRRQVVDTKNKGDQDFRISSTIITRDRSPARSKSLTLGGSGSNTSNKSSSPDNDQNRTPHQALQKQKPSVPVSLIPSDSGEDSPNSTEAIKEQTPASVVQSEEVVASSMELKVTQEDDNSKALRLEAIKAKALEIEKHYRLDCETFRMVVKMLVAKEPSLDNLLQAPLDENLLEIKQRCLDSLRHFVKDLDESVVQPDASAKATSLKTQE